MLDSQFKILFLPLIVLSVLQPTTFYK